MSTLVAFPQPPHHADQPRPAQMPLQLRVIAAGHWPWPSDGDTARLIPPRSWRPFGSQLTPSDARGAGIWSPQNFVRVQAHQGSSDSD